MRFTESGPYQWRMCSWDPSKECIWFLHVTSQKRHQLSAFRIYLQRLPPKTTFLFVSFGPFSASRRGRGSPRGSADCDPGSATARGKGEEGGWGTVLDAPIDRSTTPLLSSLCKWPTLFWERNSTGNLKKCPQQESDSPLATKIKSKTVPPQLLRDIK